MRYLLEHSLLTDRNIPALTVALEGLPTTAPRAVILHGLISRKESHIEELYILAREGIRATAMDLALHGERPESLVLHKQLDSHYVDTVTKVIYGTSDDLVALLKSWGGFSKVGIQATSAGGLAAHAFIAAGNKVDVMSILISSPDWLTVDPTLAPPPGSLEEAFLKSVSPANFPERYPPIALHMYNGLDDLTIRPSGSRLLYDRLKPLYAGQGISDRLRLDLAPGLGHVYTDEMRNTSTQWLCEHLLA